MLYVCVSSHVFASSSHLEDESAALQHGRSMLGKGGISCAVDPRKALTSHVMRYCSSPPRRCFCTFHAQGTTEAEILSRPRTGAVRSNKKTGRRTSRHPSFEEPAVVLVNRRPDIMYP